MFQIFRRCVLRYGTLRIESTRTCTDQHYVTIRYVGWKTGITLTNHHHRHHRKLQNTNMTLNQLMTVFEKTCVTTQKT